MIINNIKELKYGNTRCYCINNTSVSVILDEGIAIVGEFDLVTVPSYYERKNNTNVEYFKNKSNHTCVNRKLDIDCSGNFRACPGAGEIIGNILEQGLEEVFCDAGLYMWWTLSKDKLSTCSKCIHRYGCNDCIVSEQLGKDGVYTLKICKNMEV